MKTTDSKRSDMKTKRMLVLVCWFLLVAVGCDNGDVCEDYESDYEALVAGAKACLLDEDCQRLSVFAQMTMNGYEYVNQSLTKQDLNDLDQAWLDANCHGGSYGFGCGGVPPPEAACVEGQCGPAPDPLEACDDGETFACEDVFACEKDSDCVKVGGECCPCTMGGSSTAINICCIDVHEALLGCGPTRRLCDQSLACNDLVPACEDGQCALVENNGDDE